MGSTDEVQVVAVQELADHIGSKGERDAAVVLSPALDIFVWVRPQQITQEAWRKKTKKTKKKPTFIILTTHLILFREELTVALTQENNMIHLHV